MTVIKGVAFGLAVIGFGFGIASAYYWWKSSREPLGIKSAFIRTSAGIVVTAPHLESYLQRAGVLNAKAAICGAIGVSLSTVSGIIGSL